MRIADFRLGYVGTLTAAHTGHAVGNLSSRERELPATASMGLGAGLGVQ
jgi:hypothetical protein